MVETGNVLFEPEMYTNASVDEAMGVDETASMNTNAGVKTFENGGGVVVEDASIFTQ